MSITFQNDTVSSVTEHSIKPLAQTIQPYFKDTDNLLGELPDSTALYTPIPNWDPCSQKINI